MKKSLLLLTFSLLAITNGIAQEKDKKEISNDANDAQIVKNTYNKWTVEVVAGQSKGIKPYSEGYFSSNPEHYFGSFKFNNWTAGVRYMFSPKFGVKLDFSSDLMKNSKGSESLDFKTQQYRISAQGVVNSARLFNIEKELGRFNFLLHGGLQVSQRTPKNKTLYNKATKAYDLSNPWYNHTEDDGGVVFGISPEFRVFKDFSIIADYSMFLNFRQHYNWNGTQADRALYNLTGQMSNITIGLTYSFGKDDLHGDWAIITSKEMEAIDALDKKIGELEAMMNDVDKDGVPDYLDVENNSIAGVAVDTKGRMIDINKNGVPDELEKYLANSYVDKSTINNTIEAANSDMIKRMINEGYVAAYFEFDVVKPTDMSSDGIGFILNYLRTNPTSSVDIVGHADEIGRNSYNDKLATNRAKAVKDILIKSGVNPYRLNVIPGGVDKSVDPKSPEARRLVRKVTFKIK
jgi:OOP family OmpA-OmpF porin